MGKVDEVKTLDCEEERKSVEKKITKGVCLYS